MKSACLAVAMVFVIDVQVAMEDDKSALAGNDLVAGADDRIFRVDRADLHECSELVTDRKELAALRHK